MPRAPDHPTFITDEAGNTTIFSIFMIVVILALTGASVDFMRMEANRAQLQGALDRAIIAATDLDQESDPSDVVENYLATLGLDHALGDIESSVEQNSRDTRVTGMATMDTVFLRMSGIDSLDFPVLAAANETVTSVEISLVLDISSSMNSRDRIGKAKGAATSFVDTVLDDERREFTALNLVPYGGHVNPGEAYFEYVGGQRNMLYDPENAPEVSTPNAAQIDDSLPAQVQALSMTLPVTPINVVNMVLYYDNDDDGTHEIAHRFEGFPGNEVHDLPSIIAAASVYAMAQDSELTSPDQLLGVSIRPQGNNKTDYYQIRGDQNGTTRDIGPVMNYGWHPGETFQISALDLPNMSASFQMPAPFNGPTPANMTGTCLRVGQNEFDTLAMPNGTTALPTFDRWGSLHTSWHWGWCPSELSSIQYYSNDREELSQAIDDMRMHGGTGTGIAMKYGLSLLAPSNAPVINHMINVGEVDARFVGRPAAWDTENNEKYLILMSDGGTTMQNEPSNPYDVRNTNENISDGNRRVEITSRTTQRANLLRQCDLAKANGIVVYTVAFETGGWAADDLLACASSPAHYFHVEGDEIYTVFDTLARQINSLRLTQ